jgi:hypothetical protein
VKMAEIKNQDMEEEIATALIELCCETMIKVRPCLMVQCCRDDGHASRRTPSSHAWRL